MEPIAKEENKRRGTVLIPYRKRGNEYEFYLQMRDHNVPRSAGKFAMFGGGIEEGESLEQGLLRELQEELEYTPRKHQYWSHFEDSRLMNEVFIEEVGTDFESGVIVHEGEYGKFVTVAEAVEGDRATFLTQLVVFLLDEYLRTMYG